MDVKSLVSQRRDAVWLQPDSGSIEAFAISIAEAMALTDWPLADHVVDGVPIYLGERVQAAADLPDERRCLMAEWVEVFARGPGIIVIKGAIADEDTIDTATRVFEALIEQERLDGVGAGDHFAKPGSNDRVWNGLQKHCLADPENFVRYYASDALAMASEAWLGRGYQVTAQVNRVNPGGTAQTPHRDYHLGFMTAEQMSAFPGQIHGISPLLTLQGAVAHCDMPLESGPTLFLPGSQRFFEGYLAFSRPEFQAFFKDHHVQLPLQKGDAVFFNPAVMHGAGTNSTKDILRMANLLQVSSAFGRAMESVDRTGMVLALFADLQRAAGSGALSARAVANVIAASAEGYAFPTNLDLDPPVGGLAPKTQAEVVAQALDEAWEPDQAREALIAHAAKRQP